MRKQLSPKVRFAAFVRDSFTCQYCGRKAPEVALHADHVRPVLLGGTNALSNIVTACRECNQGKAARPIPDGIAPLPSDVDPEWEAPKCISCGATFAPLNHTIKRCQGCTYPKCTVDGCEKRSKKVRGKSSRLSPYMCWDHRMASYSPPKSAVFRQCKCGKRVLGDHEGCSSCRSNQKVPCSDGCGSLVRLYGNRKISERKADPVCLSCAMRRAWGKDSYVEAKGQVRKPKNCKNCHAKLGRKNGSGECASCWTKKYVGVNNHGGR